MFAYPPYSLTFVTGGCVACHAERSTRARDGRHGACGPRPPMVQPPGAVGIVELTLPPSHRVRGQSRHAAAIRHFGYFACAAAARGCTGARPERCRTATPSSLQLALRPCVSASTSNKTVGPDQGSAARPAQHEPAPPLRLRRLTSSFEFICSRIIARSLRPTDAIKVVRDPRECEADIDGRAPRLEVVVKLSRTDKPRVSILNIARQSHA